MSTGPGATVVAGLLSARLLIELGLAVAPLVIAARLLPPVEGVLAGLVVSSLVVVLWGLALSPRRRVNASLAVRVSIELALVAGTALALTAVGLPVWGAALAAGEAFTLTLLTLLGLPPGAAPRDRVPIGAKESGA